MLSHMPGIVLGVSHGLFHYSKYPYHIPMTYILQSPFPRWECQGFLLAQVYLASKSKDPNLFHSRGHAAGYSLCFFSWLSENLEIYSNWRTRGAGKLNDLAKVPLLVAHLGPWPRSLHVLSAHGEIEELGCRGHYIFSFIHMLNSEVTLYSSSLTFDWPVNTVDPFNTMSYMR